MSKEGLISKFERKNSKIIYGEIINKKAIRPSSELKIEQIFGKNLDDSEWVNIYSIPFLATIEVKLRSFQIKINHYYYFTNKRLHHVRHAQPPQNGEERIEISPNCTFCNTEIETINHLFVECPRLQHIWEYTTNILNGLGFTEEITGFIKLFGLLTLEHPNFEIGNHILLSAKYYIHISRCKKLNPSVRGLKKAISDTEYLERKVAQKRNKSEKHNQKWNAFLAIAQV